MTAAALLDEMIERGVKLRRVGDELEWESATPGEMTASVLQRLAANKAELMAELERREAVALPEATVQRVKGSPAPSRPVAAKTVIGTQPTPPPVSGRTISPPKRRHQPRESKSGRFASSTRGPRPRPQQHSEDERPLSHSWARHVLFGGEGCAHPDCVREFASAGTAEAAPDKRAKQSVPGRKSGFFDRLMYGGDEDA